MSDIFDVAVIGAGMIGSASARHLAAHEKHLKICLIGPEEPEDIKESTQSNYGSHYDEGRVTRVFDKDKIKGILSRRSIDRYRDLEQQSGVKFYTEIGCLIVAQDGGKYLDTLRKGISDLNAEVEEFDHSEMKEKFPYLNLEKPCKGYFERAKAGYISARGIVKAYKIIAEKNGCKFFNDSAEKIEEDEETHSLFVYLEKGERIQSKKVLIATGVFTNFSGLLNHDLKFDMKILPLPNIKYEIREQDLERLCKMPSILHIDEVGEHDASRTDHSCLILPPILYPDGKYYIKMGSGFHIAHEMKTQESLLEWFRGDISDSDKENLIGIKNVILPDIKPVNIVTDTCAITLTPSNHPYIGMVSDQIGVAVAGNGYAAKSSDEFGLIAAKMIVKGSWDYDIPQEVFQPKFI